MSMRATDPGEGNQYAEQNVGLRDSDPTMSSSEAEGSQSRIGGQTPSHSSVAHATASLQRTAVRRNVITLGNTLPVELLINVFSFLVHGHVFAIQQLVRLSAVCSYWRRIAISYAPLWTNIELSQSSLAELAFERSQGLPVHLHLIPSNRRIMAKDYRRISKSIEEHAHRIVTIWFTMDPSKCASLFSRFSPTLPALRSMILECTRLVPSRPSEPALKMRLDRRTSIVHTTAPALRTLKITQLSLPWTLSMFRGLTALRIDGDECSETPKLSTFCHVLAACPDLESLTLVDTGPFNAHQFGVAPVSLPKLRLLTVRFGEYACDAVPAHTSIA
ncbi:hypothetical protein DENSPDRAFT_557256 [Dentipellis sp. KUC8613]|nr:hypothetical protein DENSPDRAFT_557256 [Dentipellis sp. KUC8613]